LPASPANSTSPTKPVRFERTCNYQGRRSSLRNNFIRAAIPGRWILGGTSVMDMAVPQVLLGLRLLYAEIVEQHPLHFE
jgi:hypothetical protein